NFHLLYPHFKCIVFIVSSSYHAFILSSISKRCFYKVFNVIKSYPLFIVYFVIYMNLISIKNKEKTKKWRKERFIKHASMFLMGFSLLFISMIVPEIGKVLIHYKFFEFVLAM